MMPEPFRLAFIGVDHPHGAGWRELLPHFEGDIAMTAIVPAFGAKVASLEERYAEVPRFADVSELLANGTFDGAVVCLPNSETPKVVAALATAGKHVLMEKPGAASESDFGPAAEAVRRSGIAFQTGYLWRYDPGAERLAAMIQEGRFGKLISVEMRLITSDVTRRGPGHYLFNTKQSGRGFFNWLACHYLDLLPYVTATRIVAVTAKLGCFGAEAVGVEDGGTAILELSNGAIATFTGGYWMPRWAGESHWTVRGNQRWVHWDPSKLGTSGEFRIHGPQPQFHAMEETFALPADATLGYGGSRAVRLIRDWLSTANSGTNKCRNSIESTLSTLRLLDRIYQSSDEGRRIEL